MISIKINKIIIIITVNIMAIITVTTINIISIIIVIIISITKFIYEVTNKVSCIIKCMITAIFYKCFIAFKSRKKLLFNELSNL